MQNAILQALKTEDEARECEECGSEAGKGKEAGPSGKCSAASMLVLFQRNQFGPPDLQISRAECVSLPFACLLSSLEYLLLSTQSITRFTQLCVSFSLNHCALAPLSLSCGLTFMPGLLPCLQGSVEPH